MSIEENPYPGISESITQTGAHFPEFLSKNFARILQRIEILWSTKECVDYLDSLFLGDNVGGTKNQSHRADHSELNISSNRSSRQGFPMEAVKEIVLLKQVHQLLYPTINFNPYDPFSGSELVAIETHSQTNDPPHTSPADKTYGDNDTAQTNLLSIGKAHEIAWPIIRNQHDLIESAEHQYLSKNVYPLQGKAVGEILVQLGVIDPHTLRIVCDMQKRPAHKNQAIGEILVEIGILKQDDLKRSLLVQAGILMVDVLAIEISPEITRTIPHAKSREKLAIPIGNYHDTLYLAVNDPFTFADQSFFSMMTGMKVCLVFAPINEIINRLNKHGIGNKATQAAKDEFRNLARMDVNFPIEQVIAKEIISNDVSENDSSIVNLVNQIIVNAIQAEASDIHIELFKDCEEATIRFRRDGNMERFADFSRSSYRAVVSRIKIMANLDISEMRLPQDGKISFSTPNGHVELRVSTIPAMLGVEFVTIRILSSGEPLPLNSIGMSSRDLTAFQEIFRQPYGLILVCGPTGSGKTTTLHSVLKELNTEDRKIWTVEDPVEISQPHLCQIQINSKIGMTFATVLRALLRADPDVIMIGEMRDQETAKIALEAPMTGHLVLSTLHTNSATETVSRLLDLNIDPFNLSDALQAILAQRLARKLCTACAKQQITSVSDLEDLAKEYYQSSHAKLPSAAERQDLIRQWRINFGVDGNLYLKQAVGCEMCNEGYKGRIGLYELLQITPTLRHLIREQSAASDFLATGVSEGMKTLKQDGIEKVLRGITDMAQVHGACI